MKKLVYIDLDNVLCDCDSAFNEWNIKNPLMPFPQSQYGFFLNLEPTPNAIESYNRIKKLYDVKILSRPSVRNPMCYTEKRAWVEKHLGLKECINLILCCDKTLVRGDYLIDDNIQTGMFEPEWKHIHFGSKEFPNWDFIVKYLTEIY